MRLSSLVVAVLLLVSPVLLAQHSSGGGSSSGGSSHGSSSGGSSSASHASSGHSSGSSASSSSHSSGGSGSRSSSIGSATSRANTQPSRPGGAGANREPSNARVQGHKVEPGKNPQPEHRRFFAFLRHRKHEPKPPVKPAEAHLRRRACPPGQSAGKHGRCVDSGATVNTSNLCAGAYTNGVSCPATTDMCTSIRGQAAAAAAELRSINAEMQTACPGNSTGQECSSVKQRHEAALARYRMLLNGAPGNCRGTLVDPLSL